jgi:hypothetical protein
MRFARGPRFERLGLAVFGALVLAAPACGKGATADKPTADRRASAAATASAPTASTASRRTVTFEGACDASGSVELDERTFVLADDEDNVLRVYDADRGGRPLHEIDLGPALGFEKSAKKIESDLEAATRIGDRAYFLASHGRTSKGKRDPNRLFFFATTLPPDIREVAVIGQPYRSLLEELEADPRFADFQLSAAASRAPKEPGGLNIEGMTAEPDGGLLIGFRSPVPDGRALLFRLRNPDGVLAGEKAQLSDPVRLDLGGLGVRALSFWHSRYLALGGPSGDGGPFQLFRFDGGMSAERVTSVDLEGFGAEGFFTPDARDEILVLSDDGTRLVNGRPCKKLKQPAEKSFRGVWVRLPNDAAAGR